MPVYRCPIHGRWVDSERDEDGCPACLEAGGEQASAARKRHRGAATSSKRAGQGKTRRKRKLLLYAFMMALGASALALPQVQDLLRDQGLGEVADRAQRMSSGVEEVATKVKGGARSAADKLGELRGETAQDDSYGLSGETLPLRTTHAAGASGLAYLPPRDAREPRPLLVWLHGRGSEPREGIEALESLAERWRFGVLAPAAHAQATPWEVGEGPRLGDDEQHVLACMQELYENPRLTVDARRVAIVGAGRGGQAALRLATHESRFTHVAVLDAPVELRGLGELKPPLLFATTAKASPRVERAYEQLRGLGYPVQKATTSEGEQDTESALRAIVQRWLGG